MTLQSTFQLKEISNGVLVGRPKIVSRLPTSTIRFWRMRQVEFCYGSPLGIPFETFRRIMRKPMGSITIPNEMFREFLLEDLQFIDGYIDALEENAVDPLFTVEAFDASFWVIHTSSEIVADHVIKRGFDPVEWLD